MAKQAKKSVTRPAHVDSVISVKVSEKGAISIYGMGRFPVTLYKDQLLTILNKEQELRGFIEKNDAKLKDKPAASNVEGAEVL